jgi:hypothetical protein
MYSRKDTKRAYNIEKICQDKRRRGAACKKILARPPLGVYRLNADKNNMVKVYHIFL